MKTIIMLVLAVACFTACQKTDKVDLFYQNGINKTTGLYEEWHLVLIKGEYIDHTTVSLVKEAAVVKADSTFDYWEAIDRSDAKVSGLINNSRVWNKVRSAAQNSPNHRAAIHTVERNGDIYIVSDGQSSQ